MRSFFNAFLQKGVIMSDEKKNVVNEIEGIEFDLNINPTDEEIKEAEEMVVKREEK